MQPRHARSVIIALAFVAAVYQGGSSTAQERPEPFRITETAYRVAEAGATPGRSYLQWVAVVENPNTEWFGKFPRLTVAARNAADEVIGTEDHVLGDLPPGAKIAASTQITVTADPAAVASVEFTVGRTDWQPTTRPPESYPPFTASGVTVAREDPRRGSQWVVQGDVANPYGQDIDSLAVTALLRDGAGVLVGGYTTYTSAGVAAYGSRSVRVSNWSNSPDVATAERLARPFLTDWNRLSP